jgi:hypothetical protein
MVYELFTQILSSSVIISIPIAIIYFFGTLINLRSVNRSKEDTCLYGLYFAMFFITIPSLIYYYFFHNQKLNSYLIDLLKPLFPITIQFTYFHDYFTIILQFIIILYLSLLLTDFDKFLQMHSPRLYIFLLKCYKILSKIHIPKMKSCGLSESSSDKKCEKNRGMNYCLLLFILSSITIFSTLYFFLSENQFEALSSSKFPLGFISLVLSIILLFLVACNLPSVHNEYRWVKVILSEGKDYLHDQILQGQLLQNGDTLVKICSNDKKHIEINKQFIRYIETDGTPKREKLLECILSMPQNFIILCFYFIFLWVLLNLLHLLVRFS